MPTSRFACPYSDSEKELLLTHYATKGPTYLCGLLPGRTHSSVRKQAGIMGLRYAGPGLGGGGFLSDAVRHRLLTERRTRREWAQELGVSLTSINRWINKLDLNPKKNKAAPKPASAPKPDYRTTLKTPQGKKPTMRRAEADSRKSWQYPMHSPEYKAWMASKVAGKIPVYGIDAMNRPTVRYTHAPA